MEEQIINARTQFKLILKTITTCIKTGLKSKSLKIKILYKSKIGQHYTTTINEIKMYSEEQFLYCHQMLKQLFAPPYLWRGYNQWFHKAIIFNLKLQAFKSHCKNNLKQNAEAQIQEIQMATQNEAQRLFHVTTFIRSGHLYSVKITLTRTSVDHINWKTRVIQV